MWNDIIGQIDKEMPRFNDYMLTRFRKEDIAKATERVDLIFEEAMKYLNTQMCKYEGFKPIKYIGSNVLTPEQRIEWLLEKQKKKGHYNVLRSELILVECVTEYNNTRYSTFIYLPYLFQGNIVINSIKNYVLLAIIERIIYRSKNGIVIKVMQRPLHFKRTHKHKMTTVGGKHFVSAMITSKLHYNKKDSDKKSLKTPLFIYFLAEFGLIKTLNRFELTLDDIFFTETDDFLTDYYTFQVGDRLYLHARKNIMGDVVYQRIVSALHYLFSNFDFYTLDDIYAEDGRVFKIMLGKIVFGYEYKTTLAYQQAVTHLDGVRDYLDPITKRELETQKIKCENIWDLLIMLFVEFDDWLTNHSPNDLYETKLGVLELIMGSINNMIFNQCYSVVRNQKPLDERKISQLLKMGPMTIANIHQSNLVRSSQIFNDNELISCMGKKVRQAANQQPNGKKSKSPVNNIENFFHTSFPVVESLFAISNSSPCISGSINPFAPIEFGKGYFTRPEYASDIDGLERYLPKR